MYRSAIGGAIISNDSQFSPIDYLILTFGSIVFYLSLAMILKDPRLSENQRVNNGKVIAKLIMKTGEIKRKQQNEISWYNVHQAELFYGKDMIFTGDDATAEVALQNGTYLSLGPNTLITFAVTNGVANLMLTSGSLMGKITNDSLEIKVLAKDGEKNLVANNAFINLAAGTESKIELIAGKGTLEGKAIAATESAIKIIGPAHESLALLTPNKTITFSWEADPSIKKFELLFSPHFNFQKIILKKVTQNSTQVLLDANELISLPTNLYWKVIGVHENGKIITSGPIAKIHTSLEKPLKLLNPINHQTLFTTQKKLFVTFEWEQSLQRNEKYFLEISPQITFVPLIYSRSINTTQVSIPLEDNTYYWRLKKLGSDSNNSDYPWSDIGTFIISSSTLRPPILLGPEDGKVFLRGDGPVTIPLAWSSMFGKYFLKISTDQFFTEEKYIDQIEISNNYYQWSTAKIGTFYWKVQGIGPNNQESDFSSPQSFQVVPKKKFSLPPQFRPKPAHLEVRLNQYQQLSNIFLANLWAQETLSLLEWPPITGATSYRIQIAKDAQFKKVLWQKDIEDTVVNVNKLPAGNYYWRLRVNEGQLLASSDYTDPVQLVIMPKLPNNTSPPQQSFLPNTERFFTLTWQDNSTLSSGNYLISYSFFPNFSKPEKVLAKQTSQMKIFARNRFGKETLFWTLQLLDATLAPLGPPSPIFTQMIHDKIKLGMTEITSHPPKSTVVLNEQQRIQNLHFKWRPVVSASNYRLQLSKGPSFSSPFLDTSVAAPELPFLLEVTEDKLELYVRVKAQAPNAEESPWPDPTMIAFYLQKFIPPVQLQKPEQEQVIPSRHKTAIVQFAWTHPHEGLHYLLMLCKDKNCEEKVTVKLTRHKSTKISLSSGKRYYWKVYSLYPYPDNFAGDYRQLRQSCPDSIIGEFTIAPPTKNSEASRQ